MLKLYTRNELIKSLNDRIAYCNERYADALKNLINAAEQSQGTNAIKCYADALIYSQTEIDRLNAQLHIVEMTEQG